MKQSIATIIAVILLIPASAFITQYLWNTCLVPAVDPLNQIGFLQALGINILSTILFKGTNLKPKLND
jgi:hypothetical protein|tara:strand:+ start:4611 stop:4814 length:204 start_codon:yes stop_codon:yes gene_type:complete